MDADGLATPPLGLGLEHHVAWRKWRQPGDPLYDLGSGAEYVPGERRIKSWHITDLAPLDTGWFVFGPTVYEAPNSVSAQRRRTRRAEYEARRDEDD